MEKQKEFNALVAELRDTVKVVGEDNEVKLSTMTAEQQERYDKINTRLDEIEEKHSFEIAKLSNASSDPEPQNHVNEFTQALYKFSTGDRHTIKNIEVKSGYHPSVENKSDNLVRFDFESAGALLMPAEIASEMLRNIQEVSPLMSMVRVSQTNAPQKTRTLRTSTPGGNWIEEEGQASKGVPKYRTVTLTPHKWVARYGFSIEQFQDSAWDIVGELNMAFREDLAVDVGTAIIKGSGAKQPRGFIHDLTTYSESTVVAPTPNLLIRLQEQLLDAYQANAQWLFNRKMRAYIRTLTLGDTAFQYVWEVDYTRRAPTLLLGSPINIASDGDMAGVVTGNYSDQDIPVVYGDWKRGYEVVLHTDMYMIDDMYTNSDRFVRNLNIMARLDGQPLEAAALVGWKATT